MLNCRTANLKMIDYLAAEELGRVPTDMSAQKRGTGCRHGAMISFIHITYWL